MPDPQADRPATPVAPVTAPAADTARIARAAFVAMPITAFMLDDAGHPVLHTRQAERRDHHRSKTPGSGQEGVPFSDLTHYDHTALLRAIRSAVSSGMITLPMHDVHRINVLKDVTFHLSLMRIEGITRKLYMLSQDHLRARASALQVANQMREHAITRGQKLEAHIADLQDSFTAMETLAQAISHDLKSPINKLSSLLNMFHGKYAGRLPSDAVPYLEHMQAAVVQMETLTTKLRAHAQSAAAPLHMQLVGLHGAVRAVIDLLDAETRALEQDIALSDPKVAVMAEPALLQTLLGNLLTNALKHGRSEHALRIEIVTRLQGVGATLAFTDTGTGFEPDQSEAIFAPFLRLNPTADGSGQGLATGAEPCRRHNWEVSARTGGPVPRSRSDSPRSRMFRKRQRWLTLVNQTAQSNGAFNQKSTRVN